MAGRVIICILMVLFLFPIAFASSIDPSDWSFRRNIVLSASKALSDYQVKVVLDTQSLIAAGKMRSDCADIRFADSDRFSSLSYFLESGCNTPETVFWINVPIIVPEKKIFAYYGQPASGSESSGERTFIFFDGFEGSDIDASKWFPQGCVSVYGGYARMYSLADPCSLKLIKDLPNSGVIQLKARRGENETGSGPGFVVSYPDNSSAFEMRADKKENRWVLYSGKPSPTSIYGGAIDLKDHLFRVAYDVSGRIYYFYVDSSQITRNRAYSPGALISLHLLSGGVYKDQGIGDSYYDYFFVRKYADTEPEAGLLDEESLKPAATQAAREPDESAASKPALTTAFITTTLVVTTSSTSTSLPAAKQKAAPYNIVSQHASGDIRDEKNSSDASSGDAVKSLSIWSFIAPILAILFVFLLFFLFAYYRRRKSESLKENKEVLRWIANELLSGEDPEVIKKAVRDSGMDPSIVDKAKKTLK
jgi:hypothetical protein